LGNLGGQYGEAPAISGAGVIAGLIYWKATPKGAVLSDLDRRRIALAGVC